MKATDESSSLHDAAIAHLEQALSEAQAEITALKQARDQESRERRRIEHDLKTSQRRLQLVMDTLPESIFWKDQDLVYLGCNQNFVQDAELNSPQDIVGKTDFDLPWKREEAEFFRTCDRRVMQSNQAEMGIIEPQLNATVSKPGSKRTKPPCITFRVTSSAFSAPIKTLRRDSKQRWRCKN
ncbi:MAG: PAS domain-containing protein [Cyanobacteria bacterium P01_H01_bin.162]